MSAWDGREFVGIVLMLGGLVFLLRFMDTHKRRDLFASALLTSLVVGTHQLTAVVLASSIVIWAMLEYLSRSHPVNLIGLTQFAALSLVLSIPYIPFYIGALDRLAPPSTPLGLPSISSAEVVHSLLSTAVLAWATIGVLSTVGIVTSRSLRVEGLLFLSIALSSAVLAITIVRDNPLRPLHYLYIPALAPFPAFVLRIKERARRWHRKGDGRVIRVAIPVLAVAMTIALTMASVQRMSIAVDFYHAIERPELEALDWLRANTPSDAAVATNGPVTGDGQWYGWWIEGYAARRSLYTGNPLYFTYTEERRRVADANRFFTGNYVMENGALRAIDNFPGDGANPEIWLFRSDGYRQNFYLNDSSILVSFTNGLNPSQNRTWSPSTRDISEVVWSAGPPPSLLVRRSESGIELERILHLDGNRIVIEMRFSVSDGLVLWSKILVGLARGNVFANPVVSGTTLTATLSTPGLPDLPFIMSVATNPGTNVTLNQIDGGADAGTQALLILSTEASARSIQTIWIQIEFPTLRAGAVVGWDAFPIASANGVEYVFQDKRREDALHRFLSDQVHFRLLFENSNVAIFRIL